jgi:hypothetical protein
MTYLNYFAQVCGKVDNAATLKQDMSESINTNPTHYWRTWVNLLTLTQLTTGVTNYHNTHNKLNSSTHNTHAGNIGITMPHSA